MKNEPKVNLLDVLKEVVEDKSVDDSVILDALKKALISAARKYLHIEKKINVDIDMETNEVHVFLNVEVVDDYPDYDPNMTAEEVAEMDEGYMLVDEARDFNEDAQAGDSLYMELPTSSFGRQAIQTAKQLLTQHIRSAECQRIMDIYRSRIGTIINGTVLRLEQRNVIVDLGNKIEAELPAREQIPHERLTQGASVKAVIARVEESTKSGAQVILSRSNADFLKALLRQEVPEIYEGTVEIKAVARDSKNRRAKIAVYSRDEKIDPVGACVGMKGARVQTIVRELGNERIDIVHWDENFDVFVQRSLAPASVLKMFPVPDTDRIVIIVDDENLAQAIGKGGQNVELAGRLVDRKLDVHGEQEWSQMDEESKNSILAANYEDERRMRAKRMDEDRKAKAVNFCAGQIV